MGKASGVPKIDMRCPGADSDPENRAGAAKPSLGAAGARAPDDQQRDRPRVLVIDDDPLASRALRRVVQQGGGVVIAEAASGREGIELARQFKPDIAFVDLVLGAIGGLRIIEELATMNLGIRPILLTVGRNPDDGVAAIRAGARGFLSKSELLTSSLPRLLDAAMADELVCSRVMITAMVERLARSPVLGTGYRPVRSQLTGREWEVLDLLCAKRSTDQVADELVISIETVRTHVKNIMRKLGARSRAELIITGADLRAGEGRDRK